MKENNNHRRGREILLPINKIVFFNLTLKIIKQSYKLCEYNKLNNTLKYPTDKFIK